MGSLSCAALAALLAFLAGQPAAALAAPAGLQEVAAAVRAPNLRDGGRADVRLQVGLALVLAYRNSAELDGLVEAQGDPASPFFSHFLGAEQFRSEFAPTGQAYDRVIACLRRAGFSIERTFANRTVVDVSAPAPTVERYFRTEIHRVRVDGRELRYANAIPAYLPPELAGAVDFVLGLDNIEWFHPANRAGSPAAASLAGSNVAIGLPLTGPTGHYGPLAFAQGYDLPVQHQIPNQPAGGTYDGSGFTAGIEMAGDASDEDLATFLTYFGITRTGVTTRVLVDGGPQGSSAANVEATLDYETIVGLAPGANVDIYEFPDFENKSVLDGYAAAVSDDVVDTINSSLTACETADIWMPRAIAHLFEQGSAQGQTFHAATGDGGTWTYGCNKTSIATPADTPYGVAVGGTRLEVAPNGDYVREQYWNQGFGNGAGSGGVSVVFKLPRFQRDMPGITQGGRNIPDISFDADYRSPEDVVYEGRWQGIAGTSLASPIFGGCMVELDQIAGHRLGDVTEPLYRRWLKLGYGSGGTIYARDVTTGTSYGGILVPGPGYDLATGIGSLDCFVGGVAFL